MSIDVFIVVAFLVLTLVIGLGHGKKVKTIQDYALGGRNFSTTALVATIVATYASGSGFFVTLSKTYTDGLYYMFARFGIGIYFLLMSFWLIPRMGEFLGKTSIAEAMGDMYGKKTRVITAICGAIGSLGSLAIQFKVFGNIVGYFLNIPSFISIIIASIITTIYSAFGGIRSVTFTDILQLFAFGCIIPMVGFLIWNQFYNEGYTIAFAMQKSSFNFKYIFSNITPDTIGMYLLFIYLVIPDISPTTFQRISMGKSLEQVKQAFFISGIILIIIQIVVAWIPFLISTMNPNIPKDYLLSYIVDTYSYNGLKGLVVVAIIAFAMSTADSRINASSVLFTNDIYNVFIKTRNWETVIPKIFAFILGSAAIVLSLVESDLLAIAIFANSFYWPVVTPIFLLSIFGFRSSSKSVLIGMTSGFIATILWKIAPFAISNNGQKILGIIISMLCNIIFLFGSHYLLRQPGGWIGIKDKNYYIKREKNKNHFKNKISKFIKEFNLMDYFRRLSPNNDITYTFLGVYFIICTITTMYSTQVELLGPNAKLMKIIYPAMLVTGTSIALYPIWPLSISTSIKRTIMQIWYPFSVFYMLIFFSLFFVLVSKFAILQVSLFTINLMIASLLLGWRLILPLVALGFPSSIKLYQHFFNVEEFIIKFGSPEFIILYLVLIVSITFLLFLKPKEDEEKKKTMKINYLEKEVDYTQRELSNITQGMDFLEKQLKQKEGSLKKKEVYLREQVKIKNAEISKLTDLKDEFLRNIMHESNTPMTGIISMCDVLYSCYDQLDNNQIKRTIKDIVNSGDRLKSYVNSIVDLSKLTSKKYNLTKEDVNLGKLAEERTILYKKIFSDEAEAQKFIFDIKDDFIVNCDKYYITQTIDNLISNAVTYGRGKPIIISLKREEDGSTSFSIKDQGIGIPKLELMSIFEKFSVGSKTKTPAGGRGVGLALCKSVLEAHDGTISATSNEKGSIFTFTLPKKV